LQQGRGVKGAILAVDGKVVGANLFSPKLLIIQIGV
jgi:hypothetical protein